MSSRRSISCKKDKNNCFSNPSTYLKWFTILAYWRNPFLSRRGGVRLPPLCGMNGACVVLVVHAPVHYETLVNSAIRFCCEKS